MVGRNTTWDGRLTPSGLQTTIVVQFYTTAARRAGAFFFLPPGTEGHSLLGPCCAMQHLAFLVAWLLAFAGHCSLLSTQTMDSRPSLLACWAL